ncbi:ankyrin repeat domain-containing protein [Yoonia sp. F2084L]|uniref:ankyrin repeat domain-containing protein n=1 Tax=Yoonia sp. F2084L TaxID=2926419 RepID=UPI001FF0F5A2|nr:ankyrin repeat domain-containing protein [Yoonia sp. F2084L]MCK0096610.1 ankyrin repeat domain-containing protein [Yoonia sp. F2084L]
MPKRIKSRQSLEEILASCSDTLFPAQMGKAEVQVNSTDVEGDTPLHVLTQRGNTYGIKLLLEAGAHVNALGDMSETPLHIAVRKGNAEVVALLLDSGADPDIVSEFDETPRSMTAQADSALLRRLFAQR